MTLGEENGLKVVKLWSGDADSWALAAPTLYRIGKFAQAYDSDADVGIMIQQLKFAFVHPQPGAHMLVLLRDKTIVGHLVVTHEEWFGTRFATITQFELDEAIPRELAKTALGWIEDWARTTGAKFVQVMARDEKVARAFSTFHGYQKQRVMMRKPLSTDVAPTESLG